MPGEKKLSPFHTFSFHSVEYVGVVLHVPTLSVSRYVRRFERVTAVRKSPRHKRQPVQITP